MVMLSLSFASRNQMMLLMPNRIFTTIMLRVKCFWSTIMKSKKSERSRWRVQEIKLIGTNIKLNRPEDSSGMILPTNLILHRCFRVCWQLSNTTSKLTIRWTKLNVKWSKGKEPEVKTQQLVVVIRVDIINLTFKANNKCKEDKTKWCLKFRDLCSLKWCQVCLQLILPWWECLNQVCLNL